MKTEQWSPQEIEEYRHDINLLYSKANAMRNQAMKECFTQIQSCLTSHMRGVLNRMAHFGHKPQMR